MLSVEQQLAFDQILQLLQAKHKRIRLVGSAGTGKTYLVSELVAHFYNTVFAGCGDKIYITAPTNKALSILQTKIDVPVEFKTIHSALKMRRITDPKSGQQYFAKNKYTQHNKFDSAKLCIVDECSMLNSEFIGGRIFLNKNGQQINFTPPYLENYDFPIIFVGDSAQLNPVGEPYSPVFQQDYPEVQLTKIIRQAEGNPIIHLSRNLDEIPLKAPNMVNNKGYLYSKNITHIINNLAEVNGTNELKYLAYTNRAVNYINDIVRKTIYKTPHKIEEGETIVFDAPFKTFFTNQEVKVKSLAVVEEKILIPTESTRYNMNGPVGRLDTILIKCYRINDNIVIVHEDAEHIYKDTLKFILDKCKNHGWDYRGRDIFVDQFANVKYNHAITVHKSQGSTYKRTILNIGDINFCKDAEEKKRLLYTAVTRASDLVVLYNVK